MDTYKAPKLKIKKKGKMGSAKKPVGFESGSSIEGDGAVETIKMSKDLNLSKPKTGKTRYYKSGKSSSKANIIDHRGLNDALGQEMLSRERLKNELKIRKKIKGIK